MNSMCCLVYFTFLGILLAYISSLGFSIRYKQDCLWKCFPWKVCCLEGVPQGAVFVSCSCLNDQVSFSGNKVWWRQWRAEEHLVFPNLVPLPSTPYPAAHNSIGYSVFQQPLLSEALLLDFIQRQGVYPFPFLSLLIFLFYLRIWISFPSVLRYNLILFLENLSWKEHLGKT